MFLPIQPFQEKMEIIVFFFFFLKRTLFWWMFGEAERTGSIDVFIQYMDRTWLGHIFKEDISLLISVISTGDVKLFRGSDR